MFSASLSSAVPSSSELKMLITHVYLYFFWGGGGGREKGAAHIAHGQCSSSSSPGFSTFLKFSKIYYSEEQRCSS